MAEKSGREVFYLEIMVPVLFVFFVFYGMPAVFRFIVEMRSQVTCIQGEVIAPDVDSPSPPASGTGPPVAGDGGDTG